MKSGVKQIDNFLKTQTPFAVIQYFESLKISKRETYKKYELMFVNVKNDVVFRLLEKDEIDFIKANTDQIKLVLDVELGKVYEFKNFKEYKNKITNINTS
jgi:hypothetical protein